MGYTTVLFIWKYYLSVLYTTLYKAKVYIKAKPYFNHNLSITIVNFINNAIYITFVSYEQDYSHNILLLDAGGDYDSHNPPQSRLSVRSGTAYGKSFPAGYISGEVPLAESHEGGR